MKNNTDKDRRSLVFLKLRPYRQSLVSKRINQKLSAKYYEPFEVLEKIGSMAYRLELPTSSKIHPVFQVSQLKPVLGFCHMVMPLLKTLSAEEEVVLSPEEVLEARYDSEGYEDVLVKWRGLPVTEQSWMRVTDFAHQFPSSELEGKLSLSEGGIDMAPRGYVRRKKPLRTSNEGAVQSIRAVGVLAG